MSQRQRVIRRIAESGDEEYENISEPASKRQKTNTQPPQSGIEDGVSYNAEIVTEPTFLTEDKFRRWTSQLVRLAISTQVNRKMITRELVYQTILTDIPLKSAEKKRLFDRILERAQEILKKTFCMELKLVPMDDSKLKEKAQPIKPGFSQTTGIKKVTQTSTGTWILTNVLPKKIRRALQYDLPNGELETMGFAFTVCTIVGGHGGTVTEATLLHYLELIAQGGTNDFLNGSIDGALRSLIGHHYIKKEKDEASHDTIKFKYSLGRRARVEFNTKGITNILHEVYDTQLEANSLASLTSRLTDAGVPEGEESDFEGDSVSEDEAAINQ
ncbi:hypothetical protein NADFUDRAFT_53507 [Nadsonia fulvescens var. elongata DSM 6958]|uniref:MAGE domain-containing protein n=1 Tax=Nadsonia fulvescens var. elongata DSM 6958 TaxID=857566 RepID=A0A1E3PDE5_9ASCO|nr:hypothetical protein NADFUDRAFT_53507 [Nadsonia fulvescens var. elongata DSM 6958]